MASGSGWNLCVWLAGGCGWNLWVWLVGVVVRSSRYIDFLLILLIPTPLVPVLFCSSILALFQNVLYIYIQTAKSLSQLGGAH